ADLARWLGAAAVVVARADLGTLNHTALTLEAMAHRGVQLAGVVVGAWPDEPDLAMRSNVRDLETIAARPLAGALPAGAGALDPAEFLVAAHRGLAPSFGGGFDAAAFRDTSGLDKEGDERERHSRRGPPSGAAGGTGAGRRPGARLPDPPGR